MARLEARVRVAPQVMRKIVLLQSFKLKSVLNDVAEIAFFTSIESPVRSPQLKAQLLQATPSGTVKFDIANGRVLSRELQMDRFVLGAVGANTMLSAKGRIVEKLLPGDAVATAEP